jgi:hypothetical protein
MMRPTDGRLPVRAGRVPRCAGVLLAVGSLGAAVATCASTGPAAAQDVPDKSPSIAVSFSEKNAAAGSTYVGDEACNACHEDKVSAYHRTAHALTSSVASHDSIRGSFSAGSNILRTINPDLYFKMEASDKGFFQTAWLRTSPTVAYNRTERFDIVVGSGRKGQTYLFWDGDQLFQLPVSYWTELGEWVNSPGYPDGTAHFDRPTPPRCLECHASSFESRAPPINRFNRASTVLGIRCEKCHGPGGEHAARYQSASPPRSPSAAAIINPTRLSRERQMDICALCHAGAGEPLTPPLSFIPGDVLANHLTFPKLAPDAHIDVHASQVQMLERSRCFQSSPSMTCTTCHEVHTSQRELADFAARCLSCHQIESCRQFPKQGHAIAKRCVVCHMPLQQTDQIIISNITGRSLQPEVRNHQIAIYPDVHLP